MTTVVTPSQELTQSRHHAGRAAATESLSPSPFMSVTVTPHTPTRSPTVRRPPSPTTVVTTTETKTRRNITVTEGTPSDAASLTSSRASRTITTTKQKNSNSVEASATAQRTLTPVSSPTPSESYLQSQTVTETRSMTIGTATLTFATSARVTTTRSRTPEAPSMSVTRKSPTSTSSGSPVTMTLSQTERRTPSAPPSLTTTITVDTPTGSGKITISVYRGYTRTTSSTLSTRSQSMTTVTLPKPESESLLPSPSTTHSATPTSTGAAPSATYGVTLSHGSMSSTWTITPPPTPTPTSSGTSEASLSHTATSTITPPPTPTPSATGTHTRMPTATVTGTRSEWSTASIQVFGEGSAVQLRSVHWVRINGSFWATALARNRGAVIAAVQRDIADTLNLPLANIIIDDVRVGSLVVIYQVLRNASQRIPDAVINLQIAAGTFDQLQSTYQDVTGLVDERISVNGTLTVLSSDTAGEPATGTCGTACIAGVAASVGIVGCIVAVVCVVLYRRHRRRWRMKKRDGGAVAAAGGEDGGIPPTALVTGRDEAREAFEPSTLSEDAPHATNSTEPATFPRLARQPLANLSPAAGAVFGKPRPPTAHSPTSLATATQLQHSRPLPPTARQTPRRVSFSAVPCGEVDTVWREDLPGPGEGGRSPHRRLFGSQSPPTPFKQHPPSSPRGAPSPSPRDDKDHAASARDKLDDVEDDIRHVPDQQSDGEGGRWPSDEFYEEVQEFDEEIAFLGVDEVDRALREAAMSPRPAPARVEGASLLRMARPDEEDEEKASSASSAEWEWAYCEDDRSEASKTRDGNDPTEQKDATEEVLSAFTTEESPQPTRWGFRIPTTPPSARRK